jgi:Calcineurin-like phosphoesterase
MPQRFRAAATALVLSLSLALPAHAATFVAVGDHGAPMVRVITSAASCPAISVNGKEQPMTVRAQAATMPQRKTKSSPALSKPSAFPVLTCEAKLAPGTTRALIEGHALPLPPPVVNRIVVIGDTGCRIKGSIVQDCGPTGYPFATVAARAADWKPDMVLHVGDYLYRENPCPEGQTGCLGSPWGYGWDAWDADFFTPAAPLLAAAPWVFVRGNHENCDRAGQGWWRFLAPFPLADGRTCDDSTQDTAGDDSPTYAVPLGGGAQIVAMDMAYADEFKPLDPSTPAAVPIAAAWHALDTLSKNAAFTMAATHKPILGFSAEERNGTNWLRQGNIAIQSVFASIDPGLIPSKVDVIFGGHYHAWEQVSFASDHPSQFIAGFSGTQEDTLPLPETLAPGQTPAPGTTPNQFSSWVDGFGYMTLERRDTTHWDVKVWNLKGQIVNTCAIDGKHSVCDKAQVR